VWVSTPRLSCRARDCVRRYRGGMAKPPEPEDPFLIKPRGKPAAKPKRAAALKKPRVVGDTVDLRGTGSPQESYPNANPLPTPAAAPAPVPVVPVPVAPAPPAPPLGSAPPGAVAPASAPPAYAAPPPAPIRWKRRWGVTMGRWGVALVLMGMMALPAGAALAGSFGDYGPEDPAYFAGQFFAPFLAYWFFWGWWLDHLLARLGKAGAFGVTLGLGALFSLLATAGFERMPIPVMLSFAVGIAAVTFLTLGALFKDSFEPKANA
jgi:hypothetical protein